MNLKANLAKLRLKLPPAPAPAGNYEMVNIHRNIVYVSIQFPLFKGRLLYQGRLGEELRTIKGYKALKLCALNVMAQVDRNVGFEHISGLNHIDVCYRAAKDWDQAQLIANGASDLFLKALEHKGEHSRSVFGVDHLPSGFCVGLTSTWTLI